MKESVDGDGQGEVKTKSKRGKNKNKNNRRKGQHDNDDDGKEGDDEGNDEGEDNRGVGVVGTAMELESSVVTEIGNDSSILGATTLFLSSQIAGTARSHSVAEEAASSSSSSSPSLKKSRNMLTPVLSEF